MRVGAYLTKACSQNKSAWCCIWDVDGSPKYTNRRCHLKLSLHRRALIITRIKRCNDQIRGRRGGICPVLVEKSARVACGGKTASHGSRVLPSAYPHRPSQFDISSHVNIANTGFKHRIGWTDRPGEQMSQQHTLPKPQQMHHWSMGPHCKWLLVQSPLPVPSQQAMRVDFH